MSASPAQSHAVPHGPASRSLDQGASAAGLRAVAILEAAKGILVVALVIAIITLRSHIEDYAGDLLYHLHIDFDHRFGHFLLGAAAELTSARLATVVLVSSAYASIRFVEAWGLWHRRVWAEWFAVISGTIYLPWELMKVAQRASWEHVGLLVLNIVIIVYMLQNRLRDARMRAHERNDEIARLVS
jgi:uncharacterized membrane protein (DUF2068 family)